ncbi:MAG: tetratricopeptide repeat protein, partial [Bacteroidetes bacterium]
MQQFSHPVALAYCADNEQLARQIMQDLSAVIHFEPFSSSVDQDAGSLSARLANFSGPIILLVSDNFLRSAPCMEGGLSFLNARQNDILPVIIPGVKTHEDGHTETVPTNLGRVSDIIQYINYWQDRYLDLRRQKNEDQQLAEDAGFVDYLRRVREISGQAGEYIRLLRGVWHLTYEEFAHNHYEQLFIFLDEPELGEAFRASTSASTTTTEAAEALQDTHEDAQDSEEVIPAVEAEEELEVEDTFDFTASDIPGLSLLDEDATQDDTPSEEAAAHEATETAEPPSADPQELSQLIEKAWRMMDEDQLDEALLVLEAAVASYPEATDLRYNYSLLLAQAERYEAATKEIEVVLAQDPQHADALFLAGELADVQGKGEAACAYYQEILMLNDELSEVWYQLGMTQVAYFPEEVEAAEKAFKKAFKADKSNVEALYQLAQLYLRNGQEDKAIKRLEQLLELEPDRALAHYDL